MSKQLRDEYKKETGKPIFSQHGKHPRKGYLLWLESKVIELRSKMEPPTKERE